MAFYMWGTASWHLQQTAKVCMSQIHSQSSVHQGMLKHGSHVPWTSAWLAGITRANGPSRDRALALAGMYICAGNHQGMPCTLGRSRLD
jgi:hypothetical protein